MEERLKVLTEGWKEENRNRWAMEWKRKGGKVIGLLCPYVPEEIIYAAGMLPWHIAGSWKENIDQALLYRPVNSCLYCSHVLESLLAGKFDFLDGVVFSDRYQDMLRLWDVWTHVAKTPFARMVHIPRLESEDAYRFFTQEINRLSRDIEELSGTKITDESLRQAIAVCNKMRTLLKRVYDLRKRSVPPLTGAEALGIALTARVMPKDSFNQELEALLPYLEHRKTSFKRVQPRLLISSDLLDNPAYLEFVEGAGSLVAMDDLDTGSRYFWELVNDSLGDPLYSLSQRYVSGPKCARMPLWQEQLDQVVSWVKEFNIDGVLEMTQMYCRVREMRVHYFLERLKEANIPAISLRREYRLANEGQLRTRIEAFVEMLGEGI